MVAGEQVRRRKENAVLMDQIVMSMLCSVHQLNVRVLGNSEPVHNVLRTYRNAGVLQKHTFEYSIHLGDRHGADCSDLDAAEALREASERGLNERIPAVPRSRATRRQNTNGERHDSWSVGTAIRLAIASGRK